MKNGPHGFAVQNFSIAALSSVPMCVCVASTATKERERENRRKLSETPYFNSNVV